MFGSAVEEPAAERIVLLLLALLTRAAEVERIPELRRGRSQQREADHAHRRGATERVNRLA